MNLNSILEQCLVLDIETWAEDKFGNEISIFTNFEDYLKYAKVRFIGFYSYKHKKEYYLEPKKDYKQIIQLMSEHNFLVGFNSEDFDYPIVANNGLNDIQKKYTHVDCMKILCPASFKDKRGYAFKNRGNLMGYKFKKNSLECVAETMGLEFQKSKIDYSIFKKEHYTEEEKKEIVTYLRNDVMATKGMFDVLWKYWSPFTELIDYKSILDLSWIRSSIAALTYKYCCNILGTEPTFSEDKTEKEAMGGRVIVPKYEEAENVIYVDIASLYPHILCMFNLFDEVAEDFPCKKWNGNDMFKTKGYYNISNQHPLSIEIMKRIKQREDLRKTDPDNPLVYALKILVNSLYGLFRSPAFEKIHKPNGGWDTCDIGQQINVFVEKELLGMGFETIYSDTDGFMIKPFDQKHYDKDYVTLCLNRIVKKINANVPFPVDTFRIKIENFIPYILFSFTEQATLDEEGNKIKIKNRLVKERSANKKNYLYLYEEDGKLDVKLTGLPIIKDTATPLSMLIYKEVLKPLIIERKRAKFPKEFIDEQVEKYLKDENVLKSLAVEYKVKPAVSYKKDGQIHAQISKKYFNGNEGVISLIKNNKIKSVGKGSGYCSIEEAIEGNLKVEDLDLEKTYNELDIFILYEKKEVLEEVKEEVIEKENLNCAVEVAKQTRLASSQESSVKVRNTAPKLEKIKTQASQIINENGSKLRFIFEGEDVVGITNGDLVLKISESSIVDPMVKKYHYSHKTTKNRFLSFTVNDNKGFLQLGYGIRPDSKTSIHPKIDRNNFCEFDRMWLSDDLPKFSESQVISMLLKFMKVVYPQIKFIITYADGSVGNKGTIYKATNALYAGKIGVDFYLLPNGERVHPVSMWHRHKTRAWGKMQELYPGIKHIKNSEFQYRFLYILDKKEHREYLKTLTSRK